MPDSIGAQTVKFQRASSRKPLMGANLAVTKRHIPGSNSQVLDFGGVMVKEWAGEVRVASMTVYNALQTIYLGYATAASPSTVVMNGTTYSAYLTKLGAPVLDAVGAGVQFQAELTFSA